ncbi:MAG: hypothetical protein KUG77_14410 [Nannocystaceae bacterium]|nr:hypothetical protein [Nannocystaceae bacterium]
MRCLRLLWFGLLVPACANADTPGGGADTGSSTSAQEGEDTSNATPMDTTAVSASGSATTGPAMTTSSTTADESTGPGGSSGCPVGTLGCGCDEDMCNDGLLCEDGLCEPPSACDVDLLEPNDEESMPTLLGEISDDNDDGGSIFGTLDGPGDVDWYRYTGDDDILSNVDPARFVKATGGLRLCKFAECEGGIEDTAFECPAETDAETSPLGRPGCCAPAGVVLGDANCSGVLEDNMQVFMRVDQAQDACTAYELIYHF